ncbi:hypothetical protein [Bacillus halotolerans]|nr:hypothetical protein [Bacillus halotolerans]MBU5247186.1 hypothetical protein [Bacillus halotolerans]MEC1600765.1 hypothetical protein [Bacillus halotolerans]
MFEEDLRRMSKEERELAIEYIEEYLDDIAIGEGDYHIGSNGEIIID